MHSIKFEKTTSFLPCRGVRRIGATLLILAAQACFVIADTSTGTTGSGAPIENRQPTLVMQYMICVEFGTFPDDAQSTPTQSEPPNRQTPFLGEIKAIPFAYGPPKGWMLCEGQTMQISQYPFLFSLIGTAFGGNGSTTFNLPDLRGRVPVGADIGPPEVERGDIVGAQQINLVPANLPSHTHSVPEGNTGATGNGAPIENRQEGLGLHFLIAANGEIMIAAFYVQPTGWCHCDGRLLASATHGYLYSNIGTSYGGDSTNFAIPDMRGRVVIGDDDDITWPVGLAHGTDNIVLGLSNIATHTHSIPGGSTGAAGGSGMSANNYQRSLVMRWMISLFGVFPTPGGNMSFPMVSEMRLIAGETADGITEAGWVPASGQLLPIIENDTLFQVIGTMYGGDGQDTFGLPNLINRVNMGRKTGQNVADTYGSEIFSISISQLAAHSHPLLELSITGIEHLGGGSMQLTLLGTVGSSCLVVKSDEPGTGWSSLGTVNFTSATQTIIDPNSADAPKQFYRAYNP